MLLLALLGLFAGALTTLAGLGGGIVLVLALSALGDPLTALAVTAPALLLGNLHRLFLFRADVDRRGWLILAGAAPAAMLVGYLATELPAWVLIAVMALVVPLAALRKLGRLTLPASPRAIVPTSFGLGSIAATSGAGILMAPLLMAMGLRGNAYIATGSFVACGLHIARTAAYGFGGAIGQETLLSSAVLAVAILSGNAVTARFRKRMSSQQTSALEWGALALALGLATANALGAIG